MTARVISARVCSHCKPQNPPTPVLPDPIAAAASGKKYNPPAPDGLFKRLVHQVETGIVQSEIESGDCHRRLTPIPGYRQSAKT